MRAWRLDGLGGRLSLEEVAEPRPGPGAALVRIEASTLMSYMKAYVEGRMPSYRAPAGPFTPGGNCVGVIEAVGPGVLRLAVGQRVMLSSLVTSNEAAPDPTQILIGITAFGGASDQMQAQWRDGTLADKASLPASSLTPIPEELGGLDGPTLAVASRFVVPFGGLRRGRLAAGETLIVNGATGAYGSAAVLLAIAMGAGKVVAAGRDEAKLRALADLAGPVVIPVRLKGDLDTDAAALHQAAAGGADIAFDMVAGAAGPTSTLAALHALRRFGRLVLMGGMAADLPLPYLKVMLDSLEIIGAFMHEPEAYRHVLGLVSAGRLDLRAVTPKLFSLTDLHAAMATAEGASGLEAVVMTR